ncbi:MAG TPA: KEOPS complex subunit Cgi121, partial [Candidatus Thermoplasmatota archaeon]|nr:KEOPS complex subunit Cgi121 [Candidatus Thermoplasmatota archaeon]
GRSRASDLATETLVYAAGERQIGRALEKMGLKEGARGIAAVAWGPEAEAALDALAAERGWVRDDATLDGTDAKLDAWGIGAEERAVVPRERWGDLVLERVALVDVLKA